MRLDRRIRTLLALTLSSSFCVALVIARAVATDTALWVWLVWNLFLAWVPFALALAVYDGRRRGKSPKVLVPLSVLWLLFFPNAPYILTDFVHLRQNLAAPVWFDALMIASFAFTGLLLGYVSLYLMQAVVRARYGALAGWVAALGALAVSSVGIYLGRFVRLNSWDVVTNPNSLLGIARLRLEDPLGNPKLIAVALLFSSFLSVTYVVVYSLAALPRELDDDRAALERSRRPIRPH
jgi:uncharacterized membrane protein